MPYFNYHAAAKKLILEGKLIHYSFEREYHGISPVLLLFFNDLKHPIMPIREHHWEEYLNLISETEKHI